MQPHRRADNYMNTTVPSPPAVSRPSSNSYCTCKGGKREKASANIYLGAEAMAIRSPVSPHADVPRSMACEMAGWGTEPLRSFLHTTIISPPPIAVRMGFFPRETRGHGAKSCNATAQASFSQRCGKFSLIPLPYYVFIPFCPFCSFNNVICTTYTR
ncbi:hypothetical protein F5B19DRAFT_448067 [Rostrohypoxylon terebratum]|nr:hypothetical protein F5B19DRAFT_448067 [Rostrohypoxylon terebratum]